MAFLSIGALLGASSLQALATLEQLMAQSRTGATEAITLAAAAQNLGSRSQALERAARQSLILGDAQLRRRFEETRQDAQSTLQSLRQRGLPPQLAEQWSDQLAQVAVLLQGPAAQSLDSERAVAALFLDIDALNTAIAQAVQELNTRRSSELMEQVEASRRAVTRRVVGTIALAAVLALALGVWLARPFKRLERAIRRLGENELSRSVEVAGPVDVRRLGQQLEWLRVRLLELEADKARFLRHVSHELKTPLASLREGVALLQEGVTGELGESQREVVEILRQNTLALQGEIEALLRFNAAAFEARQLRRTPSELAALIQEQVQAQRLQWQAKGLQVQVQGGPLRLTVDAEKMGSAVANLLSNAIRFSPRGGTIHIVLSRVHGRVRIDLHDEGPGVHDNDRPHVFEPFYRGQRQPQDMARGTGVGLSIVREYAIAHGGNATLLDTGPHTAFRIELSDDS
ncbi:two-component sensor histidine kinase [Pulveribacter suum]|uniref:histidine kinase n=1 Tax=Pulveribacter suum TaxID=2116657 RepID=A0A2P1NPN8_9BURK|nr:two-component sensor histidine kinase [Pulveribacter suum]